MSNFWRRTPVIALSLAVLLLIAGIGMAIYAERSYQEQKTDEVGVQARILASTVSAALSFGDRKAAREYVNALQANPELRTAALYDSTGALFVSYVRSVRDSVPESLHLPDVPTRNNRLTVTAPVVEGDSLLGTVYMQTVTEPFAQRVERYGIIVLLVTMTSLVVGVLGVAQSALTKANAELAQRASDLANANDNLQAQIREREKVEEALRQAQKMEAIGQLTGGVAHDFNNLLQVIMGNLDALLRRTNETQGDLRRLVEAAVRGAERAAVLTQRLLAFSRRQPLAPKPIDVNKLVAGISDLLHRTLGETIQIETVLAGGVWRINADANQLENALLNLAVNARDAMPEGGKLTVETANAFLDEAYVVSHDIAAGQYVVIAVTDTGTGMPKETVQKAFDPFFTTKDVGKGSGLGLSQVYGFIRQSGGHAKIYSEIGEGTTIKLYLPRLVGAELAIEAATESRRAPAGGHNELVLVVEDEEDVRISTIEMLHELGYGVIAAPDGASALRLLESEPEVRLLFTDVGLPGNLNGRQLADEARKHRPGLKILFTTGYARNAIVHHGRLDPGVELISKPFSFAALGNKIRLILDGAPTD